MIRNVLSHIGGVEWYGILSILLFLAVFLGTIVWAFRLRRDHLDAMSRLPLDGEPADPLPIRSQPEDSHE